MKSISGPGKVSQNPIPLADGTVGQQVNPPRRRGCYRCIVELVLGHGTPVLGQEEIQVQKKIPDGDYEFWIVKADAHRDMLDVTFQIARDRRFLGGTIKKRFAVQGERVWQLRQMLEACEWEITNDVMQLEVNELIGKECAGSVIDDCGTTVIWQFFPITKLKQEVQQWPEHLAMTEMPRY